MQRYLQTLVTAVTQARWLTRERLLRCGSAFAFVTLGILAIDAAAHLMPGLTNAAGEHLGRDFVQFWTSARLAAAGRPEAAYIVGAPGHIADQAIAYPPMIMLLCRPLAGLSYAPALVVWALLGLGLFALALSRAIGWEMAAFASLGTPAAVVNLFLQQNGYYTAALLAAGLMLVDRHPIPGGVVLGLLCYKPQFAVLLLPALAAGGYWRVLVAAAVTAFLLTATTTALFGIDTWIAFFHRIALQRQFLETRAMAWPWMPTVFTMARLGGAGPPAAYALQSLSTISAAVALVMLWRWPCPLAIKSAGLVVATFLATPYAWAYDAVMLVFAAAWLANEGVRSGFAPWEKATVLLLLVLPALAVTSAKLLHLQVAPVLLWLSLAVVMRRGFGRSQAVSGAPAIRSPPQPVA